MHSVTPYAVGGTGVAAVGVAVALASKGRAARRAAVALPARPPGPMAGELASTASVRRKAAGDLTPSVRLGAMWNFFRGVEMGQLGSPIADAQRGQWLTGTNVGMGEDIYLFEQWLERSGRLAPRGGSAWWKVVDGSMLLDMDAAARLLRSKPHTARSTDAAVQSWITYARATIGARGVLEPAGTGRGAALVAPSATSRADRQRMLWTAHQHSIHGAIGASSDLLAREPARERVFVGNTIKSLDTVALSNWPTDRTLRADLAFGAYLGVAFPRSYPASAVRVALSKLRADRPPFSVGFGSPDNIGLSSTRWARRSNNLK